MDSLNVFSTLSFIYTSDKKKARPRNLLAFEARIRVYSYIKLTIDCTDSRSTAPTHEATPTHAVTLAHEATPTHEAPPTHEATPIHEATPTHEATSTH